MWNRGSVPIVTWEPYMDRDLEDGQSIAEGIIDGEYDDVIGEVARRLGEWVGPAVEPAAYVGMWRRVRELFADGDTVFDTETIQSVLYEGRNWSD